MGSKASFLSVLLLVWFLPAVSFGQLPSSRCDSMESPLEDCAFLTGSGEGQSAVVTQGATSAPPGANGMMPAQSSQALAASAPDNGGNASAAVATAAPAEPQGFHWRQMLLESFTFLVIEQAYVVHDDYRWVVSENGVPFNHYWRDYKQSLSAWVHSGWSDGDPNLYGYVGHPIQGALTSYIWIQNDPKSEKLEFSNTKAYWRSRLKATIWNAVYSTQWNLGPLSEPTVEKYGTKDRPPWNLNGSWPCTTKHCYSGMGQIDIVMTPLGGLGWMVGEDWLDKKVVRRVEGATNNHFLIDSARCGFNPVRAGANILHGKKPWFRASRDYNEVALTHEKKAAAADPDARRAGK
jgi:hypothetical protein